MVYIQEVLTHFIYQLLEKLLNIFASENEVYTIFLLLRYFKVEYYSFTEQNNFRSHELDCKQ